MTQGAATTWRGLLLICGAGVIWGTIGPAVDVVHDRTSLSVLLIGAYRGIVAVATLVAAVVVTGTGARCRALLRASPGRVVVIGVLTAAFQLLFFVAVVAMGVSVTTVVCLGFAPLVLLVVTAVRGRRPPSRSDLVTVGSATLGLLLVGLAGDGGGGADRPALGVLAALASGAAYAFSAELGATLSRDHDGLPIATAITSVAAVVLVAGGVPVALALGGPTTTADPVSWLLVGYLGAVTMGLAYVLLFAGLRTTASGTVVVATLLEPVTAVLIAVALLGERLSPAGVVGSVLIVLAIASLGRRTNPPEPH